MEIIDEKYLKVKNGYSLMALVQIGLELNNLKENRIINEVEIIPFRSQGFIEGGHSEWIKAAEQGIAWALKKANHPSYFDVYIKKLEGRQFIETTPTIIGTTAMKGVWKYLKFYPERSILRALEVLNIESIRAENQLIIPDFEKKLELK